MEKNPAVNIDLDLTGFYRRLPALTIQWHIGRLHAHEPSTIAVGADIDSERLRMAIGLGGGEVLGITEERERRLYRVRKAATPTQEELDVRGTRCPLPVIEARRRLRRLDPDVTLRLITDCTAAVVEIDTWTARDPQIALLGAWRRSGREHVFLLARRTGSDALPG